MSTTATAVSASKQSSKQPSKQMAAWLAVEKRLDVNAKQAAYNTFEIARDLHALYNDADYLEKRWGNRPDARDAKLADWAGPTTVAMLNLIEMYNFCPTRDGWDEYGTRLDRLLRDAIKSRDEKSRAAALAKRAESGKSSEPETSTKPRNNAIPHKEHEEVTARLESQVQSLANRSESLSEENARLRCENADLRQENAELRGRVKELERIVSRELQSA